MKTVLNPFAAAIMLAALPLAAQWPDYKTAGEPKTPDGKVNLAAPAPKAPDGHPDLSGIWDLRGTLARGGPGGPGGPGAQKEALPRVRPRRFLPELLPWRRSKTSVRDSRKVSR